MERQEHAVIRGPFFRPSMIRLTIVSKPLSSIGPRGVAW